MIAWKQTKRLTPGGLVLLFNATNPAQVVVATVASHSPKTLEKSPPEIDLFITDPTDFDLGPTTWVMVESRSSYWEAYRYVLKAIQHMTIESFPLRDYIVDLKTAVADARSIQTAPLTDLRNIFPDEEPDSMQSVDVITNWPRPNIKTSFDTSQLEALHRAVTKDLCLLQGEHFLNETLQDTNFDRSAWLRENLCFACCSARTSCSLGAGRPSYHHCLSN